MKPTFFDHTIYLSNDSEIQDNWAFGENEKGLLVILSEKDRSEENLILLGKILSAINYNLETDSRYLVLPEGIKISVLEYIKKNNISHLISFGNTPKDLGFNIEKALYKSLQLNGMNLLFANSIQQISSNQSLKKALWAALKNSFNN